MAKRTVLFLAANPCGTHLHAEPPLGPLLLLELATVVAANALRAHHVTIQGDFFPGETDEVAAARVLVHACDQLTHILDGNYRRRVLARLAQEHRAWPF